MKELFNLESVYDEQISPLMQQIIEICNQHQIPMICSFAYENDAEKGVGTCTTILNGHEGRHYENFQRALLDIKGAGGFFGAFTITTAVPKGDDHE